MPHPYGRLVEERNHDIGKDRRSYHRPRKSPLQAPQSCCPKARRQLSLRRRQARNPWWQMPINKSPGRTCIVWAGITEQGAFIDETFQSIKALEQAVNQNQMTRTMMIEGVDLRNPKPQCLEFIDGREWLVYRDICT